jgi:hypothetical protein
MNEIEIVRGIMDLPINAILSGVCIVLWRKLSAVEAKYEQVLVDLAKLQGANELRQEIKDDLSDIKQFLLK